MNHFRTFLRHIAFAVFALAVALPSPAARGDAAEAKRLFDSLYAQKIKAAGATRDGADDVALAAQMLDGARQSLKTPHLMALLCENAYALGSVDPAGYETAVEAMRLLAANDPAKASTASDNIVELRRKHFNRAKADEKAAAGGLYVDALLDSAEMKAQVTDHAGAVAQFRVALVTARQIKAANFDDIRTRLERAQAEQKIHDRVSTLRAKLLQDANDKNAAVELVMIHIVELNDVKGALRFVPQTGDEKLIARLQAMAKAPVELDENQSLDLGNWHRDLAAKAPATARGPVLARAVEYYNQFLALHTAEDLQRKGAQLAINEAGQALVAMNFKPGAAPAKVEPTTVPKPGVDPAIVPGKSLPRDKWIEVLGLVEEKHCPRGEWRIRKGELVVLPGSKAATFFVPLVITGSYELKVDLKASEDAGAFVSWLPVLRGQHQVSAKINGPGAGGFSKGLVQSFTVEKKDTYTLFTHARDDKEDPPWQVVDSDKQRPHANLPSSGVFAVDVFELGLTIKSIKIRLGADGEAKLWTKAE